MRILFCSTAELKRGLGAGKVVLEIAEAMQRLGWHVEVAGPSDISDGRCPTRESMAASLGHYVERRAADFDVVDFTHEYLPFERARFCRNTLLVARSVLLVHHLQTISIPAPAGLVQQMRHFASTLRSHKWLGRWIDAATCSVRNADLVNVSNPLDRAELVRRGVPGDRIVVLPFGMTELARARFAASAACRTETRSANPVVAFVGTFDYRKGAAEFPSLVRNVCGMIPGARFRLLGTRGLFQTREQVLRHFPTDLVDRIEVHPVFESEDLPALLKGCDIGVFPSHMEGFGFGVLEMLAAGLPVIAYDAPGPPMMLPPKYLVERGDVRGMTEKVAALLKDPVQLASARRWAVSRATEFDWDDIARETATRYEAHLNQLRGRSLVCPASA